MWRRTACHFLYRALDKPPGQTPFNVDINSLLMLVHCCLDWNQQEPRHGGGRDAGRQWKVNQPPPLFPSGPAGFVLEQNELLTVAFWSCFSSVSTSKGKERCDERSPLTGSFHGDGTTVYLNFTWSILVFLVWPVSVESSLILTRAYRLLYVVKL